METEGAHQNQDLLMIVQNLNKKLTVSHIVSKVIVKSHLNKNPYSTNQVWNIWEGLISSWWILGHTIHCLTILSIHHTLCKCVLLSSLKRSPANWSYLDTTTYPSIKSYKPVWGQTITFSRYSIPVNIHMWLTNNSNKWGKSNELSFD